MEDETTANEEIPASSINIEISHREMLASFLTDEVLHDVTLKGTDGVEVRANRFLLAARSKIFRAMFFGKFQEAKSPAVELGFQGNVIKAVVEYIVTDSAELLNEEKQKKRKRNSKAKPPYEIKRIESLVSLAEAASYFHLPKLGKRVLALFEHIWCNWPCLSLVILQASKMAGPTIASELMDAALKQVRVLPIEMITTDQISYMSAEVLETILKDEEMEMTEYELFQILQQWIEAAGGSPSAQSDRRTTAANLSKYICFEKIDPRHLSTTISASGLVSFEELSELYKIQAIGLVSQATSQDTFNTYRSSGTWTTVLPPDDEPPSKIKVEGAGTSAVNGIYKRSGLFKYIMQGTYDGNKCMFSICLYHCEEDDNNYWYLSGNENALGFYATAYVEQHGLPPCIGWDRDRDGDPPPKLLYRASDTTSDLAIGP